MNVSQFGAKDLHVGYNGTQILHGFDLVLPIGKITSIVGPNACGKSTLLKTMARLLKPWRGEVYLDGCSIHRIGRKDLARKIAILPQSPLAPEGITVAELVGRGRYPHKSPLSRWTLQDDLIVAEALELTSLAAFGDRVVQDLSGGQRQRAWIAMVLAQQPEILLLDEPTTFLDITHQIEVLDMLSRLNHSRKMTIVMVLHDLNLAVRYSDHLIALRSGKLHAQGSGEQVLQLKTIKEVFDLEACVFPDPVTGKPMMVPKINRYGFSTSFTST